jgi:ribosomal protein S18 acetylase RimI-like enzyme
MATMGPHLAAAGETVSCAEQRARVEQDFECIRVVLADDARIGMTKVVRTPERWRLVQIQLLPEWQGRGIGGRLVGALLEEARRAGVPVVLNVLKVNPARRLYERLGFRVVGERDRSFEMQAGG